MRAAEVKASGQIRWCHPCVFSMPYIASVSLNNFFLGLKLLVGFPADAQPQP